MKLVRASGLQLLLRPEGTFRRWSVGLFLIIFAPSPLLSTYMAGLLAQTYLFAILALTVDVIWGYTGILSFASAAMFGLGAYTIGVMFVHVSSAWWAIPVALIVGVVLACTLSAVIGWLAFYSRVKLSEFYISVVTLGLSVLFSQAVSYGGALTGGSNGLSGFQTSSLNSYGWYAIVGFVLLLAIVLALRIVHSDFGLIMRAIRDHEVRCRYLGIHTPLIKTVVFTACNGVAATVGVLYALYTAVVAPSLVGFVLATNVLIWVMLGGKGTIVGPVIAAVLVNALTPELSTTIPLYWQGALGLLFIVVVVALPRGLLPGAWSGVAWLFRSGRAGVTARRVGHAAEISANHTTADAPITRKEQPYTRGREALAARDRPSSAALDDGGPVLNTKDVSKSFGSFHALTRVTLQVRKGELVSLVGPNGAGKTVFVRCISDGQERSGGSVAVAGQSVGHLPPDAIVGLGLGRKFQGASVFESLTVGECLRIATWKGRFPSMWRQQATVTLPAAAADAVEALGLGEVWNLQAHEISHGQRQALELAMVLALEPSLLVLDEPTAGLTSAERAAVGGLLTQLVSVGRLAVLLIEHDFDFVKNISSRIVVLHEGRVLADGTVSEVANSMIVKDVYLGRSEAKVAQ